jgi:micrococcal nuclease
MNKNLAILILGIIFIVVAVFVDNYWQTQGTYTQPKTTQNTTQTPNQPTINKQKDGVQRSKVLRVVDGDTLELEDGTKVRFLNVDTPETVKKNTAVMCYGKEASNYTKARLTDKTIQLTTDKSPRDQYGRELRFVFLDGVDTSKVENSFNAEMIKKGFARARFYSPNTTYKKNFEAIQKEAQDTKAGIWSACPKPFEE